MLFSERIRSKSIPREVRGTLCEVWTGACGRKDQNTGVWEGCQAKQGIREYLSHVQGNEDYNDVARLQIYMGVLKRFELQEEVETVDTEVHIIRLGDIAFATNQFELFLDYGNQIKARSHASQMFIIQLANGGEGYLPTKKAEQGGHYSAFIASGQVGHVGGEQLVRETLQAINRMFR